MADPWRMAKSLEVLLDEINKRSPNRSKASDGGIGNAEHQTRNSDHNPWVQDGNVGVVTARDFTNDPGDGFDSSDFADWLRKRCKAGTEKRVKYVISDGRICNGAIRDWAWRPYTGPNAHLKHVHVSVLSTKARYDNTSSWGWYDPEDDMPTPAEIARAIAPVVRQQFIEVLTKERIVDNPPTKKAIEEAAAAGRPTPPTTQFSPVASWTNQETDDDNDRDQMRADIGGLQKELGLLTGAVGAQGQQIQAILDILQTPDAGQ